MNRRDEQLNDLLRTAQVPERAPEYWDEFPWAIVQRLRASSRSVSEPALRSRGLAWGLGLATACLLLGFYVGFRQGHAVGFSSAELQQSKKIYHELATLFPDRLQSVLLDSHGAQLVLAATAQPPNHEPLLVQICHAGECRRFITFSGQRVILNGESFDILSDAKRNVLVIGERLAWNSGEPRSVASGYHICASILEDSL